LIKESINQEHSFFVLMVTCIGPLYFKTAFHSLHTHTNIPNEEKVTEEMDGEGENEGFRKKMRSRSSVQRKDVHIRALIHKSILLEIPSHGSGDLVGFLQRANHLDTLLPPIHYHLAFLHKIIQHVRPVQL